jgi:hypothetical protein
MSVMICSSSAERAKDLTGICKDHSIYNTVIRAIIESSLVAWVGLVACAVASTYYLWHSKTPLAEGLNGSPAVRNVSSRFD